jgi:ATP-dependent Clp protease ATP-binding subunit ClpC
MTDIGWYSDGWKRTSRDIPGVNIGLTPSAKKVIELTVDEARRFNHQYIGTEHLLLGMLREGEGIASEVLESLGVELEKLRTQTIQIATRTSLGGDQPTDTPTKE